MTDDAPARSHRRLSQSVRLSPSDLLDEPKRLKGAWTAKIITLFPEVFPGVLGASLTGKALHQGLWGLEPIGLRTFGTGKHRQVDDTPAGGGAGLVLKPDVMGRALDMAALGTPDDPARWPRIYLSPRGKPFTQADARRFAKAEGMTMVCGRFEGLDQRVIDHYALEEVSIGDYVLTGGEIAAQVLLDATVRLIPGVLGNAASTEEESFSNGLLEHPQYSKPAEWRGRAIPQTLLSGDHGAISAWRQAEAEALTKARRPDLWAAHARRETYRAACKTPPRLRTERLVLRPLKAGDGAEVARIAGDYEVSKWLVPVPHPYTDDDADDFIARARAGDLGMVWAITRDKRFVGVIGAGPGLGYWLAPEVWGEGIMPEAAAAVIPAYFDASGADRLPSRHFEGNARSARVLLRLGFQEVGRATTFSRARNAEVGCIDLMLTREGWSLRSGG